jgi:hypothetical protein
MTAQNSMFTCRGLVKRFKKQSALQERYANVLVTALDQDLPESVAISGAHVIERNARKMILRVEEPALETLKNKTGQWNASVEIQALPLEQLYKMVIDRVNGGDRSKEVA